MDAKYFAIVLGWIFALATIIQLIVYFRLRRAIYKELGVEWYKSLAPPDFTGGNLNRNWELDKIIWGIRPLQSEERSLFQPYLKYLRPLRAIAIGAFALIILATLVYKVH